MEGITLDRDKLLDVVHYVCAACSPEELGRVKLHKILYYADMLHFLDSGEPLTGAEYQKQQFGPVAKPLNWTLSRLVERGDIRVEARAYFGYEKQDFISLREPASNRISEAEKRILDDVIEFVTARSAREISELSHTAVWEAAQMGETLPYFTAYALIPSEFTDSDFQWAEAEAARVGAL